MNSFKGNLIFGSKNAFKGHLLSRRDDLISLAYLLIYIVDGDLEFMKGHCDSLEDQLSSNSDEFISIGKAKINMRPQDICPSLESRELLPFVEEIAVINHNANRETIHLFVRKMSSINGRTLPFTYCGELIYKSISGNAPINVDFELIKPLNEKLKQEFLRL